MPIDETHDPGAKSPAPRLGIFRFLYFFDPNDHQIELACPARAFEKRRFP